MTYKYWIVWGWSMFKMGVVTVLDISLLKSCHDILTECWGILYMIFESWDFGKNGQLGLKNSSLVENLDEMN